MWQCESGAKATPQQCKRCLRSLESRLWSERLSVVGNHFPPSPRGHLEHPLSVSVPFSFQDLFQAGPSEQCHRPGARGLPPLCFGQQLKLMTSACELGCLSNLSEWPVFCTGERVCEDSNRGWSLLLMLLGNGMQIRE